MSWGKNFHAIIINSLIQEIFIRDFSVAGTVPGTSDIAIKNTEKVCSFKDFRFLLIILEVIYR